MTRYELLERIGAGRVAEIFRGKAVAAGGFEKPVAIKRILPHLSQDPRFVEALIAEAKILSALRHRNIVQIFDVGLGDDGQHFLVMEYVEGVDLGALQAGLEARRQKMPIDLVLHVGAEVCEALEHAQSTPGPDGRPMRLVHRDVTPSNVLVSRAGEVKLTDFGLAKRPEDGTHTGGLRGRYGYVSPEQVAGQAVDGRSDAFAVGVIMWELAAGRRLFSHLADFDALRAVRESPIASVRDIDRALPEDLDAILTEALIKDPRHRLPSAGELGKRLRGLRYSLESSTGDPAAALARMVITTQRAGSGEHEARPVAPKGKAGGGRRTKPSTGGFETSEPTVVRIRTADGFAQQDHDGSGLVNARRVIDRFEEEETRLAHVPKRGRAISEDVTSDAERARGDYSGEVTTAAAPMHLSRESGEITVSAPPLDEAERGRPPDRRPSVGGAGRGARLDKLPSTAAKGPPAAGPAPPPPVPPPRAAAADAPAPSSSPSLPARAPAPQATPPRATTPVRAAPVFGGAAAGPGTPAPRREPTGARRDPNAARLATPTAPQNYQPPTPARSVSSPPVAGFSGVAARRWWPIVIGAAVIAILSFIITRAALDPAPIDRPAAGAGAIDAGVPIDARPAVDGGTAAAPRAPAQPATAAADPPAAPPAAAPTGSTVATAGSARPGAPPRAPAPRPRLKKKRR